MCSMNQIEKYKGFRAELAIAETFEDIKIVESKAAAAAEFARRNDIGKDEQNQWGKFRVEIEAKKGEWLKTKFPHGGDRKSSSPKGNLNGIVTPKESSNARLVAEEKELVNEVMQEIEKSNEVITPSLVTTKVRKKKKQKSRETQSKQGETKTLPKTIDLREGDFRNVLSDIKENTIDLILTDPPYPVEFIELWSNLSKFAHKVLKPSGFLIAYSGQMNLPEVVKRLSEHLIYYWTFCLYHEGQTQIVNGVNIMCRWKPIFIYQKAPRKKIDRTKSDYIVNETRQKEGHNWQQGEAGINKLIELFSEHGDIVCDPFTGAGTVPKVCKELERNFIGAEIDTTTYNIAKANIYGTEK